MRLRRRRGAPEPTTVREISVDLGEVAYEGYRAFTDGLSVITKQQLPEWDGQLPGIREAWRAAADCVRLALEFPGLADEMMARQEREQS